MTRQQLEHIVRAAGAITDEQSIVVLGSQAILGAFPDAPPTLTLSREADVYPLRDPQKADLISGAIGEISQFDSTFGYYAHGLPPESCPLPEGWDKRLVSFSSENTRGVTALCLHPLDLAASKLAAGRDKDKEFVTEMLRHHLIEMSALKERIGLLPKADHRRIASQAFEVAKARVATRVQLRTQISATEYTPRKTSGPRMSM